MLAGIALAVGLFLVSTGLELLLTTARVRATYLRVAARTDAEFHGAGVVFVVLGALALLLGRFL